MQQVFDFDGKAPAACVMDLRSHRAAPAALAYSANNGTMSSVAKVEKIIDRMRNAPQNIRYSDCGDRGRAPLAVMARA